jgi:hypothetical protein
LAFKVKGETHLGPKQLARKRGQVPPIIDALKVFHDKLKGL